MPTTHVIPPGDWTQHLADAIEAAENGDRIIVESDAARELARSAIQQMRPGLSVEIVVQPSDPFGV